MRERRTTAVDLRTVAHFCIRGTRRAAFTLVGFVLVCLGLAGLLLPVLPGWLLIIAGFAVLSREYSWAHSCLAFCRRQAARSGTKLRTLATQRRRAGRRGRREVVRDPSGEVVIDLTSIQEEESESTASDSRSSQVF
jgi:Putative transmembrane protein (PGPGW)